MQIQIQIQILILFVIRKELHFSMDIKSITLKIFFFITCHCICVFTLKITNKFKLFPTGVRMHWSLDLLPKNEKKCPHAGQRYWLLRLLVNEGVNQSIKIIDCLQSTCRSAYTLSPPPTPRHRSYCRGCCRRRRGRRGGRGSSTRLKWGRARETWGRPKIRIRILTMIFSCHYNSTKVWLIDTYIWGSLSRDMM